MNNNKILHSIYKRMCISFRNGLKNLFLRHILDSFVHCFTLDTNTQIPMWQHYIDNCPVHSKRRERNRRKIDGKGKKKQEKVGIANRWHYRTIRKRANDDWYLSMYMYLLMLSMYELKLFKTHKHDHPVLYV